MYIVGFFLSLRRFIDQLTGSVWLINNQAWLVYLDIKVKVSVTDFRLNKKPLFK